MTDHNKTWEQVEPSVRLIRGDTIALEPVRWLFPGYLPSGMVVLLGGAGGCGKSTISDSFAATTSKGGYWPDGSRCDTPGDVIIWSGEDPPSVTAARLAASGADMTRVHLIDGISGEGDEAAFDPARDIPLLEATAARLASPRLLILDPVVSAVSGDGHKGNDVRRALAPVVALAQRLNCTVLGITHFTKGTAGRDPVERITGSLAFAALARVVLVAAKVKSDDGGEARRVLMRAKSNIGADDGGFTYSLERVEVAPEVEGQRVVWGEALQGTARELLAEAEEEPQDGGAKESAESFLKELLVALTPTKTVQSEAKEAGHAWATIRRAADSLGVIRKKGGLKDGWYWKLPEGAPNMLNQKHEHLRKKMSTFDTLPEDAQVVEDAQDAHVLNADTGEHVGLRTDLEAI